MRTSNSAAVLKTSKFEKELKSPGVSSFIAGTEEVHVRRHEVDLASDELGSLSDEPFAHV